MQVLGPACALAVKTTLLALRVVFAWLHVTAPCSGAGEGFARQDQKETVTSPNDRSRLAKAAVAEAAALEMLRSHQFGICGVNCHNACARLPQ